MGIHYDYKSTRGAKAMEKQAKREKKLAEKRAKKQAKSGPTIKKNEDNTIPLNETNIGLLKAGSNLGVGKSPFPRITIE